MLVPVSALLSKKSQDWKYNKKSAEENTHSQTSTHNILEN